MVTEPASQPAICRRIREVRERSLGISQEEAARRLGISLKAYRAYETFREPKISRLRQIAAAFGLDETFFAGSPVPVPVPADDRDRQARRHEELLTRLERQEELLRRVLAELDRIRSRPS